MLLPRVYYKFTDADYFIVVDQAMANSGHDFLHACVDANLMIRIRESGYEHVLTSAEALELAKKLPQFFLIDEPRRRSTEAMLQELEKLGWQNHLVERVIAYDKEPILLREFDAPR